MLGYFKNGFHGDSAYTFAIGEIGEEVKQLLKVTKDSLYKGIEKAIHGNRVGDIAYAYNTYRKKTWLWCGKRIGRPWHWEKFA